MTPPANPQPTSTDDAERRNPMQIMTPEELVEVRAMTQAVDAAGGVMWDYEALAVLRAGFRRSPATEGDCSNCADNDVTEAKIRSMVKARGVPAALVEAMPLDTVVAFGLTDQPDTYWRDEAVQQRDIIAELSAEAEALRKALGELAAKWQQESAYAVAEAAATQSEFARAEWSTTARMYDRLAKQLALAAHPAASATTDAPKESNREILARLVKESGKKPPFDNPRTRFA